MATQKANNLSNDAKIGHYRIASKSGSGGMGKHNEQQFYIAITKG